LNGFFALGERGGGGDAFFLVDIDIIVVVIVVVVVFDRDVIFGEESFDWYAFAEPFPYTLHFFASESRL